MNTASVDRERIFATPPEPFFNDSHGADCLEEVLAAYIEENEIRKTRGSIREGYYKEGMSAEFVLLLCDQLKQTEETRYLALEIYDRFMIKHICDLYDIIRSSTSEDRPGDWLQVETKLKEQAPLRALTCIQLASKLVSHEKTITAYRSRKVLLSMGCSYSLISVLKSELRVLSTLNFYLPLCSPLSYMETLLESLVHHQPGLNIRQLHNISLKVLDFICLERSVVFSLYYAHANGLQSVDDRHRRCLVDLWNNQLLVGAGCICSATYILEGAVRNETVNFLARIGGIGFEELLDFVTVVVKNILDL